VPIQVFSRDHALVDRFVAAGYQRGMWPRPGTAALPMEKFLPRFVAMFSTPGRPDQRR